ncbi:MAG: hypothetical protein WDM76_06800 [Limisphaerales bacterium]
MLVVIAIIAILLPCYCRLWRGPKSGPNGPPA